MPKHYESVFRYQESQREQVTDSLPSRTYFDGAQHRLRYTNDEAVGTQDADSLSL
jgi:hypothetical protein